MPVSDIYRSSAFGANQLCPIFAIVIFYFGMSGTMKVKAFLVTEIIILTMYLFDLKVSAISILSSKEYLVLGVTLALSGSIGMAVIVAGHVIRCASNCSTIWVALEMSELTGFFNLFAFMSILGFGGLVVSLIMRIIWNSNKKEEH